MVTWAGVVVTLTGIIALTLTGAVGVTVVTSPIVVTG